MTYKTNIFEQIALEMISTTIIEDSRVHLIPKTYRF